MKKIKKWMLASGLFGLLLTLTGCVQTIKSGPNIGQPTGDGWVYNLLVKPMIGIIGFFVDTLGSYGLAVIALTVIVRLLLMPLMLNQTKKSTHMSEKMQYLKPQMEAIQKQQQSAVTQEEQMAASVELQKLYKDNDINMFSSMGCLPLLIQMPIFTALFFTIKLAPGIQDATFLGINLGQRSLLLTALAGVAYLIQSLIGMIGIPDEQKKQMRSMMIMNPLMIVMMSFRSPAGVTLYWVVGGVVSIIQSLITNLYQKPKIKREIEEEFRKNPPKPVSIPKVAEKPKAKPATKARNLNQPNQGMNTNPKNGRNAGRQQNRK